MHVRRLLALAASVAALTAASVVAAAPAQAADPPGYSVPTEQLAASLTCSGDPATGPAPVLLVPGTTLTPDVNFSWNYAKAFTAEGRAWCWVELPSNAMADITVAAEHVVNGIRTLHDRAGRQISVVGFSQGGMVPRWALKFWPDTRAMVDDLVGIDPSNHGTIIAHPVCLPTCAPAIWQQRSGSRFLQVLNEGQETYAGISYTQVYTATDEIVVPNVGPSASSALTTGPGERSNVLVQSICPVHVAEHLTMGTIDPVGYALVADALGHQGPADPARIPRSVCLRAFMPAVTVTSFALNFPTVLAQAGQQVLFATKVPAEPALPAYAR